jgi:integrase
MFESLPIKIRRGGMMTERQPKTHADFEGEAPSSLKEFLIDELDYINWDRAIQGKPIEHYDNVAIADLMQKLFEHIEKESLRLYHSNQPWAIKEWIVQNVLRKSVTSKDSLKVAEGLVSPVIEWQKDFFDPIQNFRLKLEMSGKKRDYIREVLCVANWFVADYGRKRRYTENEILQFLRKLSLRYDKHDNQGNIVTEGRITSTFVTKVAELKTFLSSLPEDENTGRKQVIPFDLPSFPDKFNQPVFNNEDVEAIIYTVLMEGKPEVCLRLCLATIYGCRCGEIADMDSGQINLQDMTISVPTEKKGRRVPQPIPPNLKPLFSVPLHKIDKASVRRQLKAVCRKAGVKWPERSGIHSIRRAVVTALYSNMNLKELSIRRFMRWSLGRGMGVMPTYVKIPAETTDREVLECHPFVKVWEELLPFIKYLPQWENLRVSVQLV